MLRFAFATWSAKNCSNILVMQPVELQQYNATVFSKIFDKSYFMSCFLSQCSKHRCLLFLIKQFSLICPKTRRHINNLQQARKILISILTQCKAIQEQLTCSRELTFLPVTCVVRNISDCVYRLLRYLFPWQQVAAKKGWTSSRSNIYCEKAALSNWFKKIIKRMCLKSDAVVERRCDMGLKVATVLRMGWMFVL